MKRRLMIISFTLTLIIIAGCAKYNPTEIGKTEDKISKIDIKENQSEKLKDATLKPQDLNNHDDYVNSVSDILGFEPYYKTVIAFEELSDGVTSLPIEKVKAMYNEMKTVFDYVLVSEYPLVYRGNYEGETSFVDGYEEYESADVNMNIPNPINVVWKDWNDNEIVTTPLKTILLGEGVFNRFDKNIEEGRNLQMSDFTLEDSKEPINVVLGNAYKDIYEIGDVFTLELISELMNFKVVGFYKSGVRFSMDLGAQHDVRFDYTIVMPHFIPDYEPIGEAAIFQHAFHIGELTSGYIRIPEPIRKINDDTYNRTVKIVEEMAKKHGIPGLYKIPYLPVGFVW